MSIIQEIQEYLLSQQDIGYKSFHSKLIPDIDENTIIGVRTPILREYAKKMINHPDLHVFLENLPHKYFEENTLHGFLLSLMKDYSELIYRLNQFLPYIDNWATCDSLIPKIFKKHKKELYEQIRIWIKSNHCYTIRFAIKMLMDHYLDDDFLPEYLSLVLKVDSEEYYVRMMVAWYYATALAKQYDLVIPIIEKRQLNTWIHNKTIQKAIESYRIRDNQKEYLRSLKIYKK